MKITVLSPGCMQDFRMFGAPVALNSVGHTGLCSVMQQADAVTEFSMMFVLGLGTQLFKHLTVMVCTDYVTT
jgi:hypothetical protein